MTLTLACPNCAQLVNVVDHTEGQSVPCPSCGHRFVATRDELEDTVAGWIVEDVEHFLDDRHHRVETELERLPRHAPASTTREPTQGKGRSLYPTSAHGGPTPRAKHAPASHAAEPNGHRWQQLSSRLRRRLQTWAKLKPNEVFRHFYADVFCDAEHRGDEGVVLTDRRLVFHHGHKRGEAARWTPDAVVLVNSRGTNAVLTLVHPNRREHVATLDHAAADRLVAALKRGGGFTVNHADE